MKHTNITEVFGGPRWQTLTEQAQRRLDRQYLLVEIGTWSIVGGAFLWVVTNW